MEKTWRISKSEYQKKSREILKKHETVQEWADLSLDPTLSNDERMLRVMMNNDHDIPKGNYICQSYMCSVMDSDEDFIKDLIYVNSGLAILGLWDDDIIEWVLHVYSECINNGSISTTAYTGNAYEYVNEAYEINRFKRDHPEYHEFLGTLLEARWELKDKIEKFKIKRKDINSIVESYQNAYDLVKKFTDYKIPVTNLLDWKLINTHGLSHEFLKSYRKDGMVTEKKPDDSIIRSCDRKIRKKESVI